MTTKRKHAAGPKSSRKAAGFTMLELAGMAGISLSTIARCERAGRWPKQPRVLRAYLKALGLGVGK